MKKIAYAALALAPTLAFAQGTPNFTAFTTIATTISHIIGILIPAAFGLAILFFFYGIAMYVLSAGDAGKAAEGKSIMIYGVIAIAVMASVWGLTFWLQNLFGIGSNSTVVQPTFTPSSNGL